MEKVVGDIWEGPYIIDGNLLSATSNIWNIAFSAPHSKKDVEKNIRKTTFKRPKS